MSRSIFAHDYHRSAKWSKLVKQAIEPLRRFIANSRFAGMLLLSYTIVSLLLASFSGGDGYRAFWQKIHTR